MLLGLWTLETLLTLRIACFQGLCGHLSFQGSLLWASSGLRDGPLQGGGSICTVGPPLVPDGVGFERKEQDPNPVMYSYPCPWQVVGRMGLPVTTQCGSGYCKSYY